MRGETKTPEGAMANGGYMLQSLDSLIHDLTMMREHIGEDAQVHILGRYADGKSGTVLPITEILELQSGAVGIRIDTYRLFKEKNA